MAGRVSNSSGNCCVMGCGDFAVVPTLLTGEGREGCFLVSHRRGAEVVTHQVANGIALIAEAACHEVEPLLVESLQRKESCINIALYDKRLYVVVMRRGNLQLANRYRVESAEDVLYHVLNAYENYEMDALRDPLYVYGELDTGLLRKYVAKICV